MIFTSANLFTIFYCNKVYTDKKVKIIGFVSINLMCSIYFAYKGLT